MNFLHMTTLELAEYFAADNGLYTDESELSETFDQEIAPAIIARYGADDEPAMNEGFNNWTDSLCTDGILHESQYNEYCYVGAYS